MSFQNCHIAAIGEKNRQVCPHQSPAKIAGDQIRRDRRIKSPGVSLALNNVVVFSVTVVFRSHTCIQENLSHIDEKQGNKKNGKVQIKER